MTASDSPDVARRTRARLPRRMRLRGWLWLGRLAPAVPVGLGLVLLATVAIEGGAVHVAIAAAVLIAAVASVAAPSHLPQGYRASPAEAPELIHVISETAQRVGARSVDEVVIDDDFNASVVVVPPYVPISRSRVVLVLGLPLLQSLTGQQTRAVIAHELAMLAGGDDRFESTLEMARRRWATIHAAARNRAQVGWLLQLFARWYVPRLAHRTARDAVAHERYADRLDAALAGSFVAVDALLAVIVRSERLARLWRELRWWTTEQAEPPADVFAVIVPEWVRARLDPDAVRRTLRRELSRRAPRSRDYPAMIDRVHDLGEPGEVESIIDAHGAGLAAPVGDPASSAWLAPEIEQRIAQILDTHWADAMADQWRQARAAALTAMDEALDLETASAQRALSAMEQRDLAVLLWAAFGDDRAESAYRELLGNDGLDTPARLGLARLSLARGTGEWQALLQPLVDGDSDELDVAEARALLVEGLLERGDTGEVARLDERWSSRATDTPEA